MSDHATEMRKYINILDEDVWKGNSDLMYCYIDMSTATGVGSTAIRIFPKEEENQFFDDGSGYVDSYIGDIEDIIKEAKNASPIEKIRIIITREYKDSNKQLTKYINCNNDELKIISDIKNAIQKLSYLIRFHDVRENSELFSEIQKFIENNPSSNLYDLEKHLKLEMQCAIRSSDSNMINLEIQKDGRNYLLDDEKWLNIKKNMMQKNI